MHKSKIKVIFEYLFLIKNGLTAPRYSYLVSKVNSISENNATNRLRNFLYPECLNKSAATRGKNKFTPLLRHRRAAAYTYLS